MVTSKASEAEARSESETRSSSAQRERDQHWCIAPDRKQQAPLPHRVASRGQRHTARRTCPRRNSSYASLGCTLLTGSFVDSNRSSDDKDGDRSVRGRGCQGVLHRRSETSGSRTCVRSQQSVPTTSAVDMKRREVRSIPAGRAETPVSSWPVSSELSLCLTGSTIDGLAQERRNKLRPQ